ncbi:MAG: glycosyltransferase [Firmicutes bacterium]|nr:glycosyltransferase [Alicyclobacillaceae bacterium]MCL6497104.1 glycosyltransferase [Bacillota bacterium]
MKVALVHDWLIHFGGAERVLQELAAMFPEAPIYVGVADPSRFPAWLKSREVIASPVSRWPWARRLYNRYLPWLAAAFENFDLSSFDLVISTSAAVAKGVVTPVTTRHLAYVHTPMRYAWDFYHQYRTREARGATRMLMGPVFHALRVWDRVAADRADLLVANSWTVRERIRKHYGRLARVIYPPVDVDAFPPASSLGEYYLILSRLVPYKRVDLAIEAANRLRFSLWVAGDGPDRRRLERLAGPTVRFLGRVDATERARLLASAQALLFPGEEDFGIVPVEAQAAGRPVIALGRGGARETVVEGLSGVLFTEPTVDHLVAAIESSRRVRWDSEAIRAHARRFGPERFRRAMAAAVEDCLAGRRW